jgi:hypothetical protein
MRRVSYDTENERSALIEQAALQGEELLEDAITVDGKYLIFGNTICRASIEERVADIEMAIAAILGGEV